jgi:hypothetical protein
LVSVQCTNINSHFRKRRLQILKNVFSKSVLGLLPQLKSYRLSTFKNRLLLLYILPLPLASGGDGGPSMAVPELTDHYKACFGN